MTKRDNDSYEYSMYLLKKCNNEKLIMKSLSMLLQLSGDNYYKIKGLIRALDLKSGNEPEET
jgi:hypothetical protein